MSAVACVDTHLHVRETESMLNYVARIVQVETSLNSFVARRVLRLRDVNRNTITAGYSFFWLG